LVFRNWGSIGQLAKVRRVNDRVGRSNPTRVSLANIFVLNVRTADMEGHVLVVTRMALKSTLFSNFIAPLFSVSTYCEICKADFSTAWSLKRHDERKHKLHHQEIPIPVKTFSEVLKPTVFLM
jgi:hypothetical protein